MTQEIVIEVNKMVGKKNGNAEYEMQELIQYSENGEQVDFYDGSSVWYRVAKFVNGIPAGVKNFGSDQEKAYRYFMKIR